VSSTFEKKGNAVLILDNSKGITGALKSIELATRSVGLPVFFGVPQSEAVNQFLKNHGRPFFNIPFLEIQKSLSLVFYLPVLLLNTFRLLRIVSKHQIGIVHVNDLYNMCGVLLKIFKPSLAVVYHVRLLPGSYVSFFYKTWAKLILRYADSVVVVSQAVQHSFPADKKTKLIYDTIEGERHPRAQPENRKNIRLLYLANYIEGKGHKFAIEAFAQILNDIPGAQLVMAGSDFGMAKNKASLDALKELTHSRQLQNRVLFEGFSADVEKLIKSSDILLNFSESESFSMTCLEAQYFGVPVIATDCGGPSEIISHGKTGLIVPNRNIAAMANAIRLLCQDLSKRAEMGANAYLAARTKFNTTAESAKLKAIYFELV
jgi:L-malate glycosyltransferase